MTSYLAKASDPKQYDHGEVQWNNEGSKDNYMRRLYLEALSRFLGDIKGKRVLDVGSGSGWLSDELNALGADVVGIEPSETNWSASRANYPQLDILHKSLEEFSTNEQFDVIVVVMVFEHIRDLETAYKKIYSVLKSDGKLFVIGGDFEKFVNSRFGYTVEREIIEEEVVATKTNYGDRMGVLYDINRTPSKYVNSAHNNGFQLIIYYPILPPDWLVNEQEKYAQFNGNSMFHQFIFKKR